MNSFIKTMMGRRSIRRYTDEQVTDETMQTLYEVIEGTQSWSNTQCWEIVDVQNKELRQRIQATVPPNNPAYKAILSASRLLVLCAQKGKSGFVAGEIANKHGDWYMYDLGIMTQSLCLAAHSLGLGTVVVGWFDIEAVERILNCSEGVEVVSLIPLGHCQPKKNVPRHKPIAEFLHRDSFFGN